MRIGLVSDTHDLLRPEAREALAGCAHILHAGDLCSPAILSGLEAIAPVTAVRGNNDRGPWAGALPERATVALGGIGCHVLHDRAALDLGSEPEPVDVVLTGHSHAPHVEERDGVLFVNPGSAGPRRFRLPVTLALLELPAAAPTLVPPTLEIRRLDTGERWRTPVLRRGGGPG